MATHDDDSSDDCIDSDPEGDPACPGHRGASLDPSVIVERLKHFLGSSCFAAATRNLPCDGSFTVPIQEPRVRDGMVSKWNTADSLDVLENLRQWEFLATCGAFVKLIENPGFNPHDEYPPLEYAVETATLDQLDVIFEYARSVTKRNLALVGCKGSGKTLAQNCWLKRNAKQLEEQRIVWVRCDAYNLYEIWQESFAADAAGTQPVDLEECLDLKFLYVFAKHMGDERRPLFNEVLKSLEQEDVFFDEPIAREADMPTVRSSLRKRLDDFRKAILVKEEWKKHTLTTYRYVDDLMRTAQHSKMREKRRWLAASHALQAQFGKLDICILRIADGLDNVHLTQAKWKPLYRRMMIQTAHFLGKDPGPMRLHLAALRQRTLMDARAQTSYPTNKQGLQQHLRVIPHDPAPHQDVLRRRVEHFVKTHGQNDLTRILECVVEADAGELKEAFHNNHRAYLHNRVTLARHVWFRVLQRGVSQHDRGFLRSLVRSLKLRNLFLNGRFFLDTDRMWSTHLDVELGLCAPNMFHGPQRNSARTSSRWRGLCRPHLLQLLAMNGHVAEQALVDYMGAWGYPENLVRFDLDVLRAFGMIDSIDGDAEVELEISAAGKKFLSYSFTHFDALYYFALDTPLPAAFVERGFVCGHDNTVGKRTGYPRASIQTGLVFLLFLTLMNEFAQRRWRTVSPALRAKLAPLKHPITLPFEEPEGREQLLASLKLHIPNDPTEVADVARGLELVFALCETPDHEEAG